ncbi:hypothetical protein LNV08_11660 [Paucibacter sp. TC2R-5]|uniref:hypothetical protein n=1 Tax=Paucibacter sp. TC2R-5 TaxID=2893555 RepID=UPI0021E426FC|nr:hypothetical protein [Paucibacter sp. TC2R-5]MCV2359625.1 hypothetical protein [Paucibacter sp. TC2R-5]
MNIPRDKLMHFGIGSAVAAFALLVWASLAAIGLAPIAGAPAAAALAALVAGITKEGADWLDNRSTGTPMHGVEYWDAAATALPGILIGLAAHSLLNVLA